MGPVIDDSFALNCIVDHDRFLSNRFFPGTIGEKGLLLRPGDENDLIRHEYIKIEIYDETNGFQDLYDVFDLEMDVGVHGKQEFFLHGLQHAGDQHIGKIEGIEVDHVGGLKDLIKLF